VRLRSLLLGAALLAAATALAPAAAAQVVVDTVPKPAPADTALVGIPPEAVEGDTLPGNPKTDTIPADSTRAAPLPPELAARGGGRFAGVWEWDRRAMTYHHGLDLVDLLERVPGLVATRTGASGQPTGISAFGLGGGRVRVYHDGYELTPLSYGTFDLGQLSLGDLQAVRVERGLHGIRVDLTSFRLPDARPFSQLEAADGELNQRILRGLFARPLGGATHVRVTYDVTETEGRLRDEPFGATHQAVRVTRTFGTRFGLELDLRKSAIDRGAEEALPFPESVDRVDAVLRGRGTFGALGVELFGGRSSRKTASSDSTTFEGQELQAGVRATYPFGPGTLGGEARLFRASDLGGATFARDGHEATLRADVSLRDRIGVSAEARSRTLGGEGGVEVEGAVRVGPFAGVSLFGSATAGSRPLLYAADTAVVTIPIGTIGGTPAKPDTTFVAATHETTSKGTSFRAGAELARGTLVLGGAFVRSDVDRVVPFGLPFDLGVAPVETPAMSFVEVYGSVPVIWTALRVDGWYTRVLGDDARPYLGLDYGRAGVEFHNTFFGGNFEPTARLEAVFRGPQSTLGAAGADGTAPVFGAPTETYAIFNFSLQLRILDVRAFIVAENMLNRSDAFDVTGQPFAGYRATYGFRWFLRN
jgi:hypothetical protein